MTDPDRDRWNAARSEVVARWRQILERIDDRDEGGALALSNEMDEFCDEAIADRDGPNRSPVGPPQGHPTAQGPAGQQQPETMCRFCRGFLQYGGCAGLTQELNRAVLDGRWDEARALAEKYIGRLQGLDLSSS